MKTITGTMIYYYFVCRRKLWYFSHELDMEKTSDLVGLGKLIDEDSYSKNEKHIMIDDAISIDFLQNWSVVHEVKKSRGVEEASIWQLKYYMMVLEEKGIQVEKGVLDFPVLRKREIIVLTQDDRDTLHKVMEEIYSIIESPTAPKPIDTKVCKKCAYYEFCYI